MLFQKHTMRDNIGANFSFNYSSSFSCKVFIDVLFNKLKELSSRVDARKKSLEFFKIEEDQEWFLDIKLFSDVSWGLNFILILKRQRSEKELSSRVDARLKSLEPFKIKEDQEWFLDIKLFSDISQSLNDFLMLK
jgi:hypothetical protein